MDSSSLGSIFSSAASGAASGSVAGPWGAAIGGTIGAGVGLYGAMQKDKAKSLTPSLVDPNQQAMERYYARMRTAYQTGTAQSSQRANLQSTTQEALRNAFKFGGASTDVASIKDIYLKGVLGLNQQGEQMELGYAGKQQEMVNDIAQRKLDIQSAVFDQAKLDAVSGKDELGKNTNALLTLLNKKPGSINNPAIVSNQQTTSEVLPTGKEYTGDKSYTFDWGSIFNNNNLPTYKQ